MTRMGIMNRRVRRRHYLNAKAKKKNQIAPQPDVLPISDAVDDEENKMLNLQDRALQDQALQDQAMSMFDRLYNTHSRLNSKMKYNIQDYITTTWDEFISKVQRNKKFVERYDLRKYIPKRHPPELYKGLLRFNGQNNSKFYGEVRFWGIYSKKQAASGKTCFKREFDLRVRDWKEKYALTRRYSNSLIECRNMFNRRPIFDEDKITFRNRWGRRVNVTDVYPTSIYPNLDALLRLVHHDWKDAVFCGIVIKYDRKGRVIGLDE